MQYGNKSRFSYVVCIIAILGLTIHSKTAQGAGTLAKAASGVNYLGKYASAATRSGHLNRSERLALLDDLIADATNMDHIAPQLTSENLIELMWLAESFNGVLEFSEDSDLASKGVIGINILYRWAVKVLNAHVAPERVQIAALQALDYTRLLDSTEIDALVKFATDQKTPELLREHATGTLRALFIRILTHRQNDALTVTMLYSMLTGLLNMYDELYAEGLRPDPTRIGGDLITLLRWSLSEIRLKLADVLLSPHRPSKQNAAYVLLSEQADRLDNPVFAHVLDPYSRFSDIKALAQSSVRHMGMELADSCASLAGVSAPSVVKALPSAAADEIR